MDRYDVIEYIEKIHATLLSVSRGDSAATDENALFISEETVRELEESSRLLKQYFYENIRREDENYA
ncbi:MAG: hypothetical protein HDQ95_00940 [Roseburia sp.]|nr:hypothetical protein [Roseburia sp.]